MTPSFILGCQWAVTLLFSARETEDERRMNGVIAKDERRSSIHRFTQRFIFWGLTQILAALVFFLGTDGHGLKIKTRLRCAMGMVFPQIYTENYFIWINTDFGCACFFRHGSFKWRVKTSCWAYAKNETKPWTCEACRYNEVPWLISMRSLSCAFWKKAVSIRA